MIVLDVDVHDITSDDDATRGLVEIVNPTGDCARELSRAFSRVSEYREFEFGRMTKVMFSCGSVHECHIMHQPWKNSYLLIWHQNCEA